MNAAEESETIKYRNNDIKDDFNDPVLNDPCTIFTNECMNNLNIYHNLYEKSLDVFHSLVNLHINFLHNFKKVVKNHIFEKKIYLLPIFLIITSV